MNNFAKRHLSPLAFLAVLVAGMFYSWWRESTNYADGFAWTAPVVGALAVGLGIFFVEWVRRP